jgi:serine/threonine-protein kinase
MKQIGRYKVVEELGQGAMGAVYKASDPMMDRVVAVKTILASALTGPLAADYRERFFREARAAGRLAHPGIVTVYDVAEQEGIPFLVMEYVEGQTLEKLLEAGGRFDADRVIEFGQQLADALDYAHKNGVVHRDIKPANIIVTSDGRPKITDFGVAKLTASQVTTTGQLLGTPAYMAPEQFTGAPVDGRADIFSLGVLLYWLATGDRPFIGETLMAVSYKIVHTDPVPPRKLNPAIPRDHENVILKCMEKDPASRYPSGEALARDLRGIREGRALDTLNRDRMARDVEKTRVADEAMPAGTPAEGPLATDTAETVAVLPKERTAGASSTGVRGAKPAATVPLPPRPLEPTVATPHAAAPPSVAGEPPKSKKTWLVVAAVLALLLATWAVKKRMDHEALLRQVILTATQTPPPLAADAAKADAVPSPPAPAVPPVNVPGHPEISELVNKQIAAATKVAAETTKKKLEAATGAGEVSTALKAHGLQLEIKATDKAGLVLRPDEEAAASYALKAGNTATVEGKNDIQLMTDNAGALQLKLNGKELSPLGTAGTAVSVRITTNGVETLWSGNPTEMGRRMARGGAGEPGKGDLAGRKPANLLKPEKGAALDSETKQALLGALARLRIETRGVPKALELVVMMDGNQLLRRAAATASAAEAGVPNADEERFIAPGKHEFQVHLLRREVRARWTKTVSSEFAPGQQHVLRIWMTGAGTGRGERFLSRLNVTLE